MTQQIGEHASGRAMNGVRDNRFRELAPDVERDRCDEGADEKRHAPSPRVQLLPGQERSEHHSSQTAREDGELLTVSLPGCRGSALLRRRRFQQVARGRADFAAGREALNQAGDEKDDRRGETNLRIRWRECHQRRSRCHQQERECERRASSDAIGVRPDDRGTQWPREKSGTERGQRAEQATDFGVTREERVADHHGEEREDEEVVEFEIVADDDRDAALERQRHDARSRHEGGAILSPIPTTNLDPHPIAAWRRRRL